MSSAPQNLSFFEIEKIRRDFPQVLETRVHDKPLVYLDNAATTLKPRPVVQALLQHYQFEASNIHRGVHFLSEHGTTLYENGREKTRAFLNAAQKHEILFTKGTTDSLNLIAQSYGRSCLKEGDEILISEMEHHSNIVPWQMLCQEKGCVLKVIPVTDDGALDLDAYQRLLNKRTKIVAVVAISNTLGTINPLKAMIQQAHDVGAVFVVDGAQAVAHQAVDVQDLNCDFFAFSAHKIFGPTGFGVLYGREALLEKNAAGPRWR